LSKGVTASPVACWSGEFCLHKRFESHKANSSQSFWW